jgi:ATP-dependent RNA helicase RhlE
MIDANSKRELLAHLVKKNNWEQVLVFCKTKHGSNRLASQLQRDGINADAIHGNKSQNARIRALDDFKEGKVKVLVATDIAARGLDIEELPHVVNFDLPPRPEDYVHRIGRTGRAGSTGEALSLVCGEDRPLLGAIERLINKKIEVRPVVGFEAGHSGSRDTESHAQPARTERKPQGRSQAARRSQGAGRAQAARRTQAAGRSQAARASASPRAIAARKAERRPRDRPQPRCRTWISASRTSPSVSAVAVATEQPDQAAGAQALHPGGPRPLPTQGRITRSQHDARRNPPGNPAAGLPARRPS